MHVNEFFEPGRDSLETEIWRLRSLIDTCIHLFPEGTAQFDREDELLAVLGVAQTLLYNLEYRIQKEQEVLDPTFRSDPIYESSQADMIDGLKGKPGRTSEGRAAS